MKLPLTLAVLLAAFNASAAVEKIPAEQLQKAAAKLFENHDQIKDAQLKIKPDAEKGDGFKAGDLASVVFLDKGLKAEKLDKAGTNVVPLGHLYLKGLSPARDDKATENDRMHILMIDDKGAAQRIWLCQLGVQKRDGKLELVLYGSEKKPLFSVQLKKRDAGSDAPVELIGEKEDGDNASLILDVLGKYRAIIPVKKLEV